MRAVLRVSLAVLVLGGSPGCSLIFTKGPEPEVHPPPECTTSVTAPVWDTVLAVASVALATASVVAAAPNSCSGAPSVDGNAFCGINKLAWFPAGGFAATGILFTASAVVGYSRTGACRASLELQGLPREPPASTPATSVEPPCTPLGDAPRSCHSVALFPEGRSLLAPVGWRAFPLD